MQDVFQIHAMVDEDLGDVGQPLQLLGGFVASAGDEPLHLADRHRQIRQRRIEVGSAVVDHGAQGREPVLELHDLLIAVAQCADEVLQVLDDVDDVAAAVGQDPADPGQLSQGLAELVTVAVQRVGGAVDESADRCRRHDTIGAQFRCQPGQLRGDLVPLDGNCGPVDVDHGPVAHLGSALVVGGGELNVARGHQVLRDDDRLGVGRDRHVGLDAQDQSSPVGLGLDRLTVPTFTPTTRMSSPG